MGFAIIRPAKPNPPYEMSAGDAEGLLCGPF